MGGGTESLTRQDRLLCVLVENFQPVWREIEEAGVFRRRGLVSRDGLLVPQHVMIGLVMLRGLLAEAGHDLLPWADLAARRDADPDLARQFKRWMNALTEYFNGTRPLSSPDLGHLARGLTMTHPTTERTADTLAGELLAYARPEPSAATRQQRIDLVSNAVLRPSAVTVPDAFLADAPPLLASGFQRREVQQQVTEILRTAGRPRSYCPGPREWAKPAGGRGSGGLCAGEGDLGQQRRFPLCGAGGVRGPPRRSASPRPIPAISRTPLEL